MRLAFMGTPAFAVPTLAALIESREHSIEFVITQPDKPRGRGMHIQMPPVKELALRHGFRVFQPEGLKNNAKTRDLFTASKLDAVVVVAYGRMIPEDMLCIPAIGFFNVHASLLPALRGAAPINRAILMDEAETGISIMLIDNGMDSGPVYLQARTPIHEDEDCITLSKRLSTLGAQKLLETLSLITEGKTHPAPQDHTRATYAPMLSKEEGAIDWNTDTKTIYNMIRGLVPWPCAYTYLNGRMLKILGAAYELTEPAIMPGTLTKDRKGIRIACKNGFIIPHILQLEGKRAMESSAFSNGLKEEKIILRR